VRRGAALDFAHEQIADPDAADLRQEAARRRLQAKKTVSADGAGFFSSR